LVLDLSIGAGSICIYMCIYLYIHIYTDRPEPRADLKVLSLLALLALKYSVYLLY
jgi:hypothetical protein